MIFLSRVGFLIDWFEVLLLVILESHLLTRLYFIRRRRLSVKHLFRVGILSGQTMLRGIHGVLPGPLSWVECGPMRLVLACRLQSVNRFLQRGFQVDLRLLEGTASVRLRHCRSHVQWMRVVIFYLDRDILFNLRLRVWYPQVSELLRSLVRLDVNNWTAGSRVN